MKREQEKTDEKDFVILLFYFDVVICFYLITFFVLAFLKLLTFTNCRFDVSHSLNTFMPIMPCDQCAYNFMLNALCRKLCGIDIMSVATYKGAPLLKKNTRRGFSFSPVFKEQ